MRHLRVLHWYAYSLCRCIAWRLARFDLRCEDGVQVSTPVANGDGLQNIAVGIDGQCELMGHAGVGRIPGIGRWRIGVGHRVACNLEELAFVVEVDGLARMGEEDCVAVRALRLEDLNGVVALGGTV